MVMHSLQSPDVNNQEGLGGAQEHVFAFDKLSEVTGCRD